MLVTAAQALVAVLLATATHAAASAPVSVPAQELRRRAALDVYAGDLVADDLASIDIKYRGANAVYTAFHKSAEHKAKRDALQLKAQELERRSKLHAESEHGKRWIVELAQHKNVKRQSGGSVELTDYWSGVTDVSYYGTVNVGTPAQPFKINFDTGSADFWVPGPNSPTSHTKFVTTASSTLETSGQAWDITYGTGEASGSLIRDTVSSGGYTVTQQVLAIADTTVSIFERIPSDGIMGMGFSSIASSRSSTFFENLFGDGTITTPSFGVYLQRAKDLTPASGSGTIGGGSLCLGCTDTSKYTGSIAYNPVTIQAYWEIHMDGVSINGQVVAGTSVGAAIDTGTTLVYLPISIAQAIYTPLGGTQARTDGTWEVPCSAALNTLGLVFGGVTYNIPLEDLFLGRSSTNSANCLVAVLGSDQRGPSGETIAIVGALFLKSVYSVFTYSNNGSPAVGFASLGSAAAAATAAAATSEVASSVGAVVAPSSVAAAPALTTSASAAATSSSPPSSSAATSTATPSFSTALSVLSASSSAADPLGTILSVGANSTATATTGQSTSTLVQTITAGSDSSRTTTVARPATTSSTTGAGVALAAPGAFAIAALIIVASAFSLSF